ncbi:MAG: HAMP domain-containing sensor histidine kinase, partial [Thermoleophilaceae bacterium]
MSGRLAGTRLRLRLPIRFKLALVSAVLTFAILAAFAILVGVFTERQLTSSFDSELRSTATDLQSRFQLGGLEMRRDLVTGELVSRVDEELFRGVASGGAAVRVWDRVNGKVFQLPGTPDLGPLYEGVREVGGYRVVSRSLFVLEPAASDPGFDDTLPAPLDGAGAAVQYGKPSANLEATIGRVHLFLILGVLVGTLLAFVAGFVVARRAMRPISGLTKAAREVARTRDPATRLPRPAANDEVAELSATLSEMLAQLDAARTETEHTLERQREFVADASHELRTPLTSILANLELLAESLHGEQEEAANSALRSSRRMRRLVADLLLLARHDAARQAPHTPTDLGQVLVEAAAELGVIADDHDVSIDTSRAIVDGARDELHRLTLNLIENAIRHTPPGTHVRATVECVDGSVRLIVEDDGPGIPAELRDRVFERFVRGSGDRGGSSGLGLSIVHAVAESHGGTVRIDSPT